jgi:hypothetical protein
VVPLPFTTKESINALCAGTKAIPDITRPRAARAGMKQLRSMAEATCRLSAPGAAGPGGQMANPIYELTKFKLPRVESKSLGVITMCRCPKCLTPVRVGKKGAIRCDRCGQLFTPEAK